MIEVELKSVVDDLDARRAAVERAGARLQFSGRLEDRRYDNPARALRARDHVLRTRVRREPDGGVKASVDWKGPTAVAGGFKTREELSIAVDDPATATAILERLGYDVTEAIDRDIWEYALDGVTVRFERYPRMDPLVEVEGSPDSIERAIVAIGLPRPGFTAERLPDFVRRFETRTGAKAVLADTGREPR